MSGSYYEVVAAGSRPIQVLLGQRVTGISTSNYVLRFSDLVGADPILTLLNNHYFQLSLRGGSVSRGLAASHRTAAGSKNLYLRGISRLAELGGVKPKKRQRLLYRDAFPVWNSRDRAEISGLRSVTSYDTTLLSLGWTLPTSEVVDGPIKLIRLNTASPYSDHISFDRLRDLASRLSPYVDGITIFQRNPTLNGIQRSRCVFHSMRVSECSILYEGTFTFYFAFNIGRWATARFTVEITDLNETGVRVKVFGLTSQFRYWSSSLNASKTPWNWLTETAGFHEVTDYPAKLQSMRRGLEEAPHTIYGAAPALYFTQSEAYARCYRDIASRWESLMESGELFPLLTDLYNDGPPAIKRILRKHPGSLGIGHQWVQLLSGAYLTYAFALKPTYELLIETIRAELLPVKGEGSVVFEGSFNPQDSVLPQGLLDYVSGFLTSQDIMLTPMYGRAEFRSEVYVSPSTKSFGDFMLNGLESKTAGFFLPSASGIWASQPMSFVLDWIVDIGGSIQAGENLFGSNLLGIHGVGHTVNLKIETLEGPTFRCYLRSDFVDSFIDPSKERWHQADVPAVAVPLALVLATPGVSSLIDAMGLPKKKRRRTAHQLSMVQPL